MNFVSNSLNFIIKEAHEFVTTESYRNIWINRIMPLRQPGQSAEKEPRAVFILLY